MYTPPEQNHRRIVITGANSGTGKEAAKRLASAGAEVVMAVRTLSKGQDARDEILQEVPHAQLSVERLDLADLTSIRAFVDGLSADGRPIDTLINNAGVMNPPHRETTADGFELQFGSNFLGPFALTNLLVPTLRRGTNPRVVTMTSSAAISASIDFRNLNSEKSYSPMRAYAQSKLADHLFGLELARLSQSHGWGILSTLAHPGYTRTNLLMSGPNYGTDRTTKAWYYKLVPSMDIPRGTEPLLMAAADPSAAQGDFYGPRFLMVGAARKVRAPRSVRRADASRLWQAAAELTGTGTPA